jgi:hypothetical protein
LHEPQFCVLDNVTYALLDDKLYQLSSTVKGSDDLSTAQLVNIPPFDSRPPFQCILPYSSSMLILTGNRPFETEDTIAQCEELRLSSDHEIDLPAQKTITGHEEEAEICDLCLQTRHVKTCWRCYDCGTQELFSEGPGYFNVCLRCLEHGKWCRDVSHHLSKSKKGTEMLKWRATHVVVSVNFSSDEPLVTTVFQNRLLCKASGVPCLDLERREIIWPVDATILKIHLATGASNVSEAVKEDSVHWVQEMVTLKQRIKDEVESGGPIVSRGISKHFDSSRWKDGICPTCVSSLAD